MEEIQQASTTEIKVTNLTFMVTRLASDIPITQQYRELPVNAFQAIERVTKEQPDYKGLVQWDLIEDLSSIGLPNCQKLMLVDNGDGMSPVDMVDYINKMFNSSNKQSNQDNFGIGGKVSTINYNQRGVIFVSWKQGKGSLAWFWFDKDAGKIGLRNWPAHDDRMYDWCPIPDSFPKPKIIKEHGTCVILLGNNIEDNTFVKPDEIESGGHTKWLIKYSTSKFYDIPENISFKIYDGSRDNKSKKVFRTFMGQREFLTRQCLEKGTVRISNAMAHWWLMPDSKTNKKIEKNTDRVVFGHLACLYENELYGVPSNTRNRPSNKLAQFGVLTQGKRVIIYIEPDLNYVYPNTSRTELVLNSDGKELPWSHWAKEFSNALPEPIKEAEKKYIDSLDNTNDLEDLKQNFKKIENLFTFPRWRPKNDSKNKIIPTEIQPTLSKQNNTEQNNKANTQDIDRSTVHIAGTKSNQENSIDEPERSEQDDNVLPATLGSTSDSGIKQPDDSSLNNEKILPNSFNGWESLSNNEGSINAIALPKRKEVFPEIIWTEEVEELIDRPFRFISNQNKIQFNSDFRIFKDTIKYYFDKYSHLPNQENVKKIIVQVVQNGFAFSATQSILFMKNISKSKQWHLSEVEAILENPIATAGYVGGLSLIREQIHKTLRNKLKGLR